ncbi:MAG TPA: lysophospholipid acyltransferase family protein [Devosia sp.]|jgi:1-acyl-sn-glycerol-3-phosphate acyltransferase|nr:lysophospholipid acyltransferase family protein [Devosia sp.]
MLSTRAVRIVPRVAPLWHPQFIARIKITSSIHIRSAAFDVVLALWTGLFAVGIPWFSLTGAPERAIRSVTRLWAGGILAILRVMVGLKHTESGVRNDTPCLIVSNHQSTWETLAFLVMAPDVAIVAKKELLNIPVLGWYLRRSPMIIIDRASGAKSFSLMLEQSRAALSEGRSILIFPEGSRKGPEEPVKFKRGAGLLYKHLGVPALPVALNSGCFWSTAGSGPKSPGTITVSYLPIIPPGLAEAEFTSMTEGMLEAERSRISVAA